MLCKLVTQSMKTRLGESNETDWATPEWHEATGTGNEPCSDAFIHYYHHPLIAVFLNPIHAAIPDPRLIAIEIDREAGTDGLKGWCKRARMVRELAVPQLTLAQRVRAAIYIAQVDCDIPAWRRWADDWLCGKDRSHVAAEAAEMAARRTAAGQIGSAAAGAAARAAWAAVWAMEAVWAAEVERAARAAVAVAAARAAAISQVTPSHFDLLAILQRAIAGERYASRTSTQSTGTTS
jgi:hypothetical protein